MTTVAPDTLSSEARRARLFTRINKMDAWFQVLGIAWRDPRPGGRVDRSGEPA